MRRVALFLVVCMVAVAGIVLLGAWYLGVYQGRGGSVSGMMGQMMGGGYSGGMTQPMPGGVWVLLVALLAVVVIGVAGAGYYVAYPEIKVGAVPQPEPQAVAPAASPGMSWEVLLRTSKPEEKKVLEVLAAHDGSYLQKFVVKEAGLSKLKTHRIVSRLAERGVVTVERSGNTNEVSLASWVRGEKPALKTVSSAP